MQLRPQNEFFFLLRAAAVCGGRYIKKKGTKVFVGVLTLGISSLGVIGWRNYFIKPEVLDFGVGE